MINFYYETEFSLENEPNITEWIRNIINSEGYKLGEISYIFCTDEFLHDLNQKFLNHDTLTDIISFDNSLGKKIFGEIYISVDRVKENAKLFKVAFNQELHRVMIHGVLHYCGYKDKTKKEKATMRGKEDDALKAIQ